MHSHVRLCVCVRADTQPPLLPQLAGNLMVVGVQRANVCAGAANLEPPLVQVSGGSVSLSLYG